MLRDRIRRLVEALERDLLGKGRPAVGSRKRDRLPRAPMVLRSNEPDHPTMAPRVERARRRETRKVLHLPYTLAFATVTAALIGGVVLGINWATTSEQGFLGIAFGIGAEPRPTPAEQPAREPSVPPEPTAAPSPTPRTYVVEEGDTLSLIAEQYDVSVEALVEANDLDDPRLLRIGQELVIPTATPLLDR